MTDSKSASCRVPHPPGMTIEHPAFPHGTFAGNHRGCRAHAQELLRHEGIALWCWLIRWTGRARRPDDQRKGFAA
jgi:hypothetical protein